MIAETPREILEALDRAAAAIRYHEALETGCWLLVSIPAVEPLTASRALDLCEATKRATK